MKKNIWIIFLIFGTFICQSQNDTIPSTNIIIKYDSIQSVQKFYKVKDQENGFSNNLDDFIEIKNGVVKYGNTYETIRNGVSIKTSISRSEKQEVKVITRDSLGNKLSISSFKNNKLISVELYDENKINEKYHFGLIEFKESFEYFDERYFLTITYHDRIVKYEITHDVLTGNSLKVKIDESEKYDIMVTDNGSKYFVDEDEFSKIYDKYKDYLIK